MKATNSFLVLLAAMLSVISLSAKAVSLEGGNSGGGGGDARCAEYSDLVGEIALTLNNLTEEELASAIPNIDVTDFWKVKKKLKCLPVNKLHRQAFSHPKTVTTELLVSAWDVLSYQRKVRLAVHEMCVLAQYEKDGEYFHSDEITKLISSRVALYGHYNQPENHSDGTVTFSSPKTDTAAQFKGSTKEHADSVCQYFGFRTATDFVVGKLRSMGRSYDGSSFALGFATTREGRLVYTGPVENAEDYYLVDVLDSITCKGERE